MNKQNAFIKILTIALVGLFSTAAFAAPPANDNFANAEAIGNGATFTANFNATNTEATSEAGEPNQSNMGAGKTIWYKWTAPADPRPMQIAMHQSHFAVVISVFSGTALNNLVLVKADSMSFQTGSRSFLVFSPQPNATYYFRVDGRSDQPLQSQTGLIGLVLAPALVRQSTDFDKDGKTDIAVFRPSDGNWYALGTLLGFPIVRNWGTSGDIPVSGDFEPTINNNYGTSDSLVFRPSNGIWYYASNNLQAPPHFIQWGQAGDVPVTGNFLGNSSMDLGVYRPSTGEWYFTTWNGSESYQAQLGTAGDVPVWGDYDLDAKTDFGVFRPSEGTWYINSSQNGLRVFQWGTNGDIPVRGDFDGDARNDFVVFRPSDGTWYVHRSSNNTWYARRWGSNGDKPVSGDFDGDGRFDFALFRPSNSTWYILSSGLGTTTILKWGTTGDIPINGN